MHSALVTIKRVYEKPEKTDGYRVLVDRLWPRGMSKEKAQVDIWLKEIAPSNTLRKWFGHDPKRWEEFKKRYIKELEKNDDIVSKLQKLINEHHTVTLLYGAHDKEHNEAVVLADFLKAASEW